MNDSLDPIFQQEEQRKLRIQLVWRLAIAVVLVAGVLLALAWLDQGKEQKTQVSVNKTTSVRIAPRASMVASTIAIASTPAIASAPDTIASAVETTPTQTPQASAVAASKPITQSSPLPATVSTPSTGTQGTANINRPIPPVVAKPVAPVKPVEPVRPQINKKGPEPLSAPLSNRTSGQLITESAQATPNKSAKQAAAPAHYPAPILSPNGYTVQAGVFLHSSNAEKMLRQVQNAGVPAYLETRVQIGPFDNKTEAEAAVRKLRQLGLEPVIKGN